MNKTLKDQIDKFIELFPKITKEESDFVEEILKWDNEKRAAFFLAKKIFEDKESDENER